MTPQMERVVPQSLLEAKNLPSMPSAAVDVLRLCREEDTTLNDLADVISRDPALAAKLLRYSNSSLFNLGQEVTTLQRATLLLGMKSVQMMSLSFSLVGSLPHEGNSLDFDEFWKRSVAQAVAARLLMSTTGHVAEDEAFLCGLLSNIGQLVMALALEPYADVLDAAGDRWPTAEFEQDILGFHGGDVGGALLKEWDLPDLIHIAVGCMQDPTETPDDAPADTRQIAEVLYVARFAVRALCDRSGPDLLTLEREALRRFQLSEESVQSYLLSLEAAFKETSELLELPMPTDTSHEEIIQQARDAMLRVGLETAGELKTSQTLSLDISHRGRVKGDRAYIDGLTGLINHDGFREFLNGEVRARMSLPLKQALGLLIVQVDGFERLGEDLGTEGTDEAQRLVAGVLGRMTRKSDLATRLGDGLFAVVVPESSTFGLKTLSDRIRHGVQMKCLDLNGRELRTSVSLGGACVGSVTSATDGEAIYAVCKRYLDRAVSKGGNIADLHPAVIDNVAKAS